MKSKKGTVTSSKMDKTVVVTVHTYKTHPKYKKKYRTSRKFYAHDPENSLKKGDEATIYETKPLSKNKRWTIVEPNKTTIKEKEA
jgi:small subunit ribosomal protein S17